MLAAAMDAYLKRREGPNAHLWDMVAREVLEPIGAFHVPTLHTLERDGGRGVPHLSYGQFLTVSMTSRSSPRCCRRAAGTTDDRS
ncbi:MAG: hypothetical protein ACREMC_05295 [Gemmatimonadales bacterium]